MVFSEMSGKEKLTLLFFFGFCFLPSFCFSWFEIKGRERDSFHG